MKPRYNKVTILKKKTKKLCYTRVNYLFSKCLKLFITIQIDSDNASESCYLLVIETKNK